MFVLSLIYLTVPFLSLILAHSDSNQYGIKIKYFFAIYLLLVNQTFSLTKFGVLNDQLSLKIYSKTRTLKQTPYIITCFEFNHQKKTFK